MQTELNVKLVLRRCVYDHTNEDELDRKLMFQKIRFEPVMNHERHWATKTQRAHSLDIKLKKHKIVTNVKWRKKKKRNPPVKMKHMSEFLKCPK